MAQGSGVLIDQSTLQRMQAEFQKSLIGVQTAVQVISSDGVMNLAAGTVGKTTAEEVLKSDNESQKKARELRNKAMTVILSFLEKFYSD